MPARVQPEPAGAERRARTVGEAERVDVKRDASLDQGGGAGDVDVIEAEYALCLARAETAWNDSVVKENRAGTLTWQEAATASTLPDQAERKHTHDTDSA